MSGEVGLHGCPDLGVQAHVAGGLASIAVQDSYEPEGRERTRERRGMHICLPPIQAGPNTPQSSTAMPNLSFALPGHYLLRAGSPKKELHFVNRDSLQFWWFVRARVLVVSTTCDECPSVGVECANWIEEVMIESLDFSGLARLYGTKLELVNQSFMILEKVLVATEKLTFEEYDLVNDREQHDVDPKVARTSHLGEDSLEYLKIMDCRTLIECESADWIVGVGSVYDDPHQRGMC